MGSHIGQSESIFSSVDSKPYVKKKGGRNSRIPVGICPFMPKSMEDEEVTSKKRFFLFPSSSLIYRSWLPWKVGSAERPVHWITTCNGANKSKEARSWWRKGKKNEIWTRKKVDLVRKTNGTTAIPFLFNCNGQHKSREPSPPFFLCVCSGLICITIEVDARVVLSAFWEHAELVERKKKIGRTRKIQRNFFFFFSLKTSMVSASYFSTFFPIYFFWEKVCMVCTFLYIGQKV